MCKTAVARSHNLTSPAVAATGQPVAVAVAASCDHEGIKRQLPRSDEAKKGPERVIVTAAPVSGRSVPARNLDTEGTVSTNPDLQVNPTTQVSWGEIVDKITILEIKEARLTSSEAIANVRRELAALTDVTQDAHAKNEDLASLKAQLRSVNEALWDIEDRI